MSNRKRKISEEFEFEQKKSETEENIELENVDTDRPDENIIKAKSVLKRVFDEELQIREKEIENIEERLSEAFRIQHLLRYAVVSSYYGVRTSPGEWPDNTTCKQALHPAVAGLLRKTRPDKEKNKGECSEDISLQCRRPSGEKTAAEDNATVPTKVPRYIPPVTKKESRLETVAIRESHVKMKQTIIVGDVSRWIPYENREDRASHKWMVYARGPRNAADLSHIVEKVRFFLHASYRPFDVVEVNSSPFRISRRGWGEFPIRVQVHFRNQLNKPIDIIHRLTLARINSTKESIGSESVVEVWLHGDEDDQTKDSSVSSEIIQEKSEISVENDFSSTLMNIKREVEEDSVESTYASENQISDFNDRMVIKTENSKYIEDAQTDAFDAGSVKIKEEATEEIVVEDGYFQMNCENDNFMSSSESFPVINTNYNKANDGVGKHKVLDSCTNGNELKSGISLLVPHLLTTSGPLSVGNIKNLVSYGQNSSKSQLKPALTKGSSLLIRSSSVSPGSSLLLKNPIASNAVSLLSSSKSSVEARTSLFSILSKRLHKDINPAMRHLLGLLPLVTTKVSDPVYRPEYYYAADSVTTFLSWPLAKQRASEWARAKLVRELLTAQGFPEKGKGAWSTRDIQQMAKLWGYTPIDPNNSPLFNSMNGGIEEVNPDAFSPSSTYSDPKEIYKWLSSHENEKLAYKDDNDNEEVEVMEEFQSKPKKSLASGSVSLGLGARAAMGHKVTILGIESYLAPMSSFVDESARELGIIVSSPEEIIPCVFYSTAQRMLIEALKSFVNELTRSSLCFAQRRNRLSVNAPLIIKPEDVQSALLNRDEFYMFTNEGLGDEPEDNSDSDD